MTARRVLYLLIDADVTGGNVVAMHLIEGALTRGWRPIVVSPSDGPILDRARKLGVPVHVLPLSRSHHWGAALRLSRLLREERVDLVHTHASLGATALSRVAGRLAGVPVLNHSHVLSPLSRNPLVRLYQETLDRVTVRTACAGIIAVSEDLRRQAIARWTPPEITSVIHNGVPMPSPSTSARRHLGISDGAFVVLEVGRLCETKGQERLIRAVAAINRQDVHILLAGTDLTGDNFDLRLIALAKSLSIADRTHLLGFVQDLEPLFMACDVVVLPSDAEGVPLFLLEGMARGKPVIATRVGGVEEVIRNEEHGLVIPPKNVPALAEALERLMEDPTWAKKLGEQGREAHLRMHTINRMIAATFETYERAVSTKGMTR